MTGGDFSQEAYQALREAYANQLTGQDEQELEGVQVMGQRMTMETLPVDSPWRDKIEKWQYPTGKSAYADGPQKTPEEVLELMREAAAERDVAEAAAAKEEDDIDSLSDEDLDAYVDNLLAELDEDEDYEGEEDEEESEGEEEEEEEIDDLINSVLDEEEDEDEVEEVEEEIEEEVEETEEEDEPEEYDPEEIASEIQSLRDQLEALQFNPEASTDDE
jgi:hypothetical protein